MFNLNTNFLFEVHAGGHGSGFASELGHFLKNIENLVSKDSGEILNIIFPGLHHLENLHPLFVHFPIALLLSFLAIELIASIFKKQEWHQIASFFLYLGTFSALITVYFGFQAAATVAHNETTHSIMMQHKSYGITVAILSVILSVWRWYVNAAFGIISRTLYLLLAIITCFILFLGADLGGLMVYQYGVGGAAAKQPEHIHHSPQAHGHNHSH